MPVNYQALSEENREEYGRIENWGQGILADRYDERTHFVFELLQNAEDAIGRRQTGGSRAVQFDLKKDGLLVSHHGKPFDENDVRGICGINRSTKQNELTAIGRFGIGFKSVYAFTDRPEIHSGDEHFAIESYVHPIQIPPMDAAADRTVFWLPFRTNDASVFDEIAQGLQRLNTRTLLFLREIEEIVWSVEDGPSGNYLRESEDFSPMLRQITLIGQNSLSDATDLEQYFVFSRPALSESVARGHVEIAFQLKSDEPSSALQVVPMQGTTLFVFFPTILSTQCGFLMHGPYRTTPNRDNIPERDPWNQYLVQETALLLRDTLSQLRDNDALTVHGLNALPLDEDDFSETSRFRQLFETTRTAFQEEPLLPAEGGTWVTAKQALLGRGQELRALLTPTNLVALFGEAASLNWLSGDITPDRASQLRSYLIDVLDVREINPERFIGRISTRFLEEQSDEWLCRFYKFLLNLPGQMNTAEFSKRAWVRLENGAHVAPFDGNQPQAFLPVLGRQSGFPTVKRALMENEDASKFLKQIGLTTPDIVDEVIEKVLPRYDNPVGLPMEVYRQDVQLISEALRTDSSKQRERLVSATKSKKLIRCTDHKNTRYWAPASTVYLATDKLQKLFEGVPDVFIVDDTEEALNGEAARNLLIACGVSAYLAPISVKDSLTTGQRFQLRTDSSSRNPGLTSGTEVVQDHTLRGLALLLETISRLAPEAAVSRCCLLWENLCDLVRSSRETVLQGRYSWHYYSTRTELFSAEFVRVLWDAKWVPDADGRLQRPTTIVFEDIDPPWTPNAALQQALGFRPPIVAMLAKEVGIEVAALALLKKHGVTSEAQILTLLASSISAIEASKEDDALPDEDSFSPDTSKIGHSTKTETHSSNSSHDNQNKGSVTDRKTESSTARSGSQSTTGSPESGSQSFVSYLAAHPVEESEEMTVNGQTQEERMQIEEFAIQLILAAEPELQRTPTGNPGFDLFKNDSQGSIAQWIEVKAMSGTLDNHPVGLSKTQFALAQEKGARFWLYIVEKATATNGEARVFRIQDPAGNTRTFTFDKGWRDIAAANLN